MGIKGIYKEIGAGRRISLCKLAVDHLEQTGQPLRLAIDFAIWSFQVQVTRGGPNPAIRTLFYRLVRLLSLTITPIFVFDGPNKPAFKRNKRSRGPCDTVSAAMAKRMIKLFGFAIHDAPGEAEAECALLQQQGVVDAVLSEDVDTIMFGCTRTLRNWSAEALTRGTRPPTHVSLYDVAELKQGETGLDREGLVLVALMSGGDYIPEGVPGCGIKVACEAARAGFGKRLCRIKRSDPAALTKWREDLAHELRTNESRFFRVKHKALTIPEDFPDLEVLRYYTHPVVSQAATVERLGRSFPSKRDVDIVGLRDFTGETFDWTYRIGAIKFIRVMAPGLLVQALMSLSEQDIGSDGPDKREEIEAELVRAITTRRVHSSTDATPQLRVSYVPNLVVDIDLDQEEDEVVEEYGRSGLALNSDDEEDEQGEDGEGQAKGGPKKVFDPRQPDLAWVPESVAKLGVPLTVEDWEARQRDKQLAKQGKLTARRSRKKASGMPDGAMDRFVRSTKRASTAPAKEPEAAAPLPSASQPQPSLLPASQQAKAKSTLSTATGESSSARVRIQKASRGKAQRPASRPSSDVNPWSIASSQTTPKASRTKYIDHNDEITAPILISSSPIAVTSSPPHTASQRAADAQSSALLPTETNPQHMPSDHPFSAASSPLPDSDPLLPALSPRKHHRSRPETASKPAAKRTQRSQAATGGTTSGGPAWKPTRGGDRAAQRAAAAQPSIKSFGRVSEAMGKLGGPAAPSRLKHWDDNPLSESDDDDEDEDEDDADDDDEELEDIASFLSKRRAADKTAPPPLQTSNTEPSSARVQDRPGAATPAPVRRPVPIEIPSSPSAPSPFASRPTKAVAAAAAMTTVYIPRTSDQGLGYFREVDVTREEAERMLRVDHDDDQGARGAAGGGKQRRRRRGGGRCIMWRESDVTILDLTGDD